MGDLLLTEEIWNQQYAGCPCFISINNSCTAKDSQFADTQCQYLMCPFVHWLNAVNIEK